MDCDLFNNPMVKAAKEAMPEEEKERYRVIGEQIHSIDYTSGQTEEVNPAPMEEGVAYLEANLRSGLHPSMMLENEHKLMSEIRGVEWYKEWGYVAEDLKEIVTLTPKLEPSSVPE